MTRPATLFALLFATLPWAADATADVPPRTPVAAASAAATATASAAASASAGSETEDGAAQLPRIDAIDLPSERSAIPKPDEWNKAKEVVLHDALPAFCHAHVVRQWLRVRCSRRAPGAGSVVSGPSEGVHFFSSLPPMPGMDDYFPDVSRASMEVIMPLRRGDSRMVQMTQLGDGSGYGMFGQSRIFLMSQQWPKGQDRPEIHLDARPWQTDDVLGMRLGTKEEAAELGLKASWSGPYVLAVEPASPADEAGVEPGDVVAALTGSGWQDDLALGDGPTFNLLLTRNGTAKQVTLPRRRGK